MFKVSISLFSVLAASLLALAQTPARVSEKPVCPAAASNPVAELECGNLRFTGKAQQHPQQSVEYAKTLKDHQKPFAVVLNCSDSRVPPEVLFDQGFGDLFVVRVVGNAATRDVLASIEYAVDELKTKLVVVMGHQRCGAVAAAFCPKPGTNLDGIWTLIRPAVARPIEKCDRHPVIPAADWDRAVRKNVDNMKQIVANDLRSRAGVEIVGAYYSLDNGTVSFEGR